MYCFSSLLFLFFLVATAPISPLFPYTTLFRSHMVLIGCDFHPSWQQVSWLDMETGETGEQKLVHAGGEAKQFYEQLAAPVLIGMETTGNSQWFIELVEDLGHEIWIGDAAQIRASYVRKQKTDKRDAAHILKLLVEG